MTNSGKLTDDLLDDLFILYRSRDDAIRMLGKIVLANPALDESLTAVVMRLANTKDGLAPVGYDAMGSPLLAHQVDA